MTDSPPSTAKHRAARGKTAIVSVLIISLLASAGARYWADAEREKAIPNRGQNGSSTSFSSMNSFALGLLLGGLRGPLVMFLWTESESQKSDKNLEGVDTQIEWIRLLQPEFDTVHIFQIWNKAYNISVQMASLANKYSVILGALGYAKDVDREKPDDINIITAIAQIYFDKLGNSTEKNYYRRRVRQETLPHASQSKLSRQDPGWRPTKLDPILDDQFNILPAYITPDAAHRRPANVPTTQEFDEGTDLQYLPQFQPYRDGVCPSALSYNYYKRAEVLQSVYKQRHAQLSDMVIDSRPALAAKAWAEEDWDQGRRRETQAMGLPVPEQREDMEGNTESFPPNHTPANKADAELAVFNYNQAIKVLPLAMAEYLRHIAGNPNNESTYRSHIAEVLAEEELITGDRDYLAAMLADPAARPALEASASKAYKRAIWRYQQLVLQYFTDESYVRAALPPGFSTRPTNDQKGIPDLDEAQTMRVFAISEKLHGAQKDSHTEDRQEYERYMRRAAIRIGLLH